MPLDPLFIGFIVLSAVVMLAIAAGVVFAAVQAARDRELSPIARTAWTVGIIVFPVWGAVGWFAWNACGRPRIIDDGTSLTWMR